MAKQSFLLVSLQEDKAQKLAQVVQNASCRKILDYLTEKEATESDLSKKLSIPLSTVHYNLQHLQKAGLVTADEFHYSEKGKEVNHYKLANKYIIIAPKSTHGIKEKLRSILPVGILALGASFIIGFYNKIAPTAQFGAVSQKAATESVRAVPTAAEAAPAALDTLGPEKALTDTAPAITEPIIETITPTLSEPSIWQNFGLWFLLGALFVIIVYILFSLIRKK